MAGFYPNGIQEAPAGTKLWFLHLGNLELDEAFLMAGCCASTSSNPNPVNKRREVVVIAALIEMPGVDGLILFETGCGPDLNKDWGTARLDTLAPRNPSPMSEEASLPAQIGKTGHDISEVKHIIVGHLHLDHAGGLQYFKDRKDVTVYVHELEFKHAFWAVGTKADLGAYLPNYLSLDYNWETFDGPQINLFPGLDLLHSPGHTPGLVIMLLNLRESGLFIFTTDQYHVKENYEGTPQGWFGRDRGAWFRSHQMIKRIATRYNATLCFGHDWDVFQLFKRAPEFYS